MLLFGGGDFGKVDLRIVTTSLLKFTIILVYENLWKFFLKWFTAFADGFFQL